jgi:hypothetical protein
MAILIIVFLILLTILTGTFWGVLSFVGWAVLAMLGYAILYFGVVDPIKRHVFQSEEQLNDERRAELGYGPPPRSASQEMRAKLGYGAPNERTHETNSKRNTD